MSVILIARVLIMIVFLLVVVFGFGSKIRNLMNRILKRNNLEEEW